MNTLEVDLSNFYQGGNADNACFFLLVLFLFLFIFAVQVRALLDLYGLWNFSVFLCVFAVFRIGQRPKCRLIVPNKG